MERSAGLALVSYFAALNFENGQTKQVKNVTEKKWINEISCDFCSFLKTVRVMLFVNLIVL